MSGRPVGRRAFARSALAAAAIAAVAACTGTFQPGLPLALLVVDGAPTEVSRLLAYAVDPPGPATPRALRPLGAGTVAPEVDGPIVDLDWLDRDEAGGASARSALALLVSERDPSPDARAARLFLYDAGAFDVESPQALELLEEVALVVGGDFLPPAAPLVQAPVDGVCLAALSVSRDGRYVALLDRRSDCDEATGDEAVLLLVDLEDAPGGTLVWSTTASPVRGAPPVVDQARGRLEFVDDARLRSVALDDRDDDVASDPLPGLGTFDRVRDVVPYGDERLVLAADRLWRVAADGAAGEPVTTQSGALEIVETGAGLPVLVRGGSTLAVHADPSDDDEASIAAQYTGGTTDVLDQLAYLVGPGFVDTVDLLVYDPAATDPIRAVRTRHDAPELVSPSAVTWFRPRPAGP